MSLSLSLFCTSIPLSLLLALYHRQLHIHNNSWTITIHSSLIFSISPSLTSLSFSFPSTFLWSFFLPPHSPISHQWRKLTVRFFLTPFLLLLFYSSFSLLGNSSIMHVRPIYWELSVCDCFFWILLFFFPVELESSELLLQNCGFGILSCSDLHIFFWVSLELCGSLCPENQWMFCMLQLQVLPLPFNPRLALVLEQSRKFKMLVRQQKIQKRAMF